MTDDDDASADERREADALARALERGSATEDLPDEALQTAALIRYSRDGGELAAAREEALLHEVMAAADKVAARPARSVSRVAWWRWIAAFTGVAATVAIVLLVVLAGPGTIEPTALPAPRAALVSAQLARLEDEGEDDRFAREMSGYRSEVYTALGARYGAR